MEEGTPFTVDEYPLLESWPEHSRKFLGSEESGIVERSKKGEESPFGVAENKGPEGDIQGSYRLDMNEESPAARGNNSGEAQVLFIKNE